MSAIDIRQLSDRLRVIESLALITRVASTNIIGRRVVDECIENDIPLPSAIIIAREQFAGKGRGARTWHSPANKGIYTTTLHSRAASAINVLPLEVAVMLATFLRETYAVDARIKWPNDILVEGKKLAGILIEARTHDEKIYALIGIGINIEKLESGAPANSVSLAEISSRDTIDLDSATVAFVECIDEGLSSIPEAAEVLKQWRELSVHALGDRVSCVIDDRTVSGLWRGIDEHGRALVQQGGETVTIAAGDLVLVRNREGEA